MTYVMRHAMAGLVLAAGLFGSAAQASVVIGGTRVIYPAQDKDVTVKLTNQGTTPALIQSWLDRGNPQETPEQAKVPFTITPPITRVEPGAGQALRLTFVGGQDLPTDKESLFWLNVLEVPPKAENADGRNLLQFAFRTRIKVIYRPDHLQGEPREAPEALTWKVAPGKGKDVELQVHNPTPYYVNFAQVGVKTGGRDYVEHGGGMVAPGSDASFPIKGLESAPANAQAEFKFINDFGAISDEITKPLTP